MKALKRAQKEIRKGILTAINNGQYVYICEYSYDDYNYFDRNKKEYNKIRILLINGDS